MSFLLVFCIKKKLISIISPDYKNWRIVDQVTGRGIFLGNCLKCLPSVPSSSFLFGKSHGMFCYRRRWWWHVRLSASGDDNILNITAGYDDGILVCTADSLAWDMRYSCRHGFSRLARFRRRRCSISAVSAAADVVGPADWFILRRWGWLVGFSPLFQVIKPWKSCEFWEEN